MCLVDKSKSHLRQTSPVAGTYYRFLESGRCSPEEETIDKDGRQITTCENVSVREPIALERKGKEGDREREPPIGADCHSRVSRPILRRVHLTDNCLYWRSLCDSKI